MRTWEVVGKAKRASKNGRYFTSVKEQKNIKQEFPYLSFVNSKGNPTNLRHGKVSFINKETGIITNAPSPAKFSHNPQIQNRFIREKITEQLHRSPSNLIRYKQALNVQAKVRQQSKHGNGEGQKKALQKIMSELGYTRNVINKVMIQINTTMSPPNMRLKSAKSATPRRNLKSRRALRL